LPGFTPAFSSWQLLAPFYESCGIKNLFVRDQLPDISLFNRRNHGGATQLPLALLALRRKQMSLETFVAFDLTAGGDSKPFGRGSVSLDFGHINLLFSLIR
jgi:hypothetical protein